MSTESLILPNYAPENLLPPSPPSSLALFTALVQPIELHGKTAVKTVFNRKTALIHFTIQGGEEAGFFASILLLGSSGSQRLGEFLSSLSQSDSCCVFVCVCPAGDHPSRKGWIWLHHLLGFPCESAGCRSRQVLHEDDEVSNHPSMSNILPRAVKMGLLNVFLYIVHSKKRLAAT